MIKIFMCFVLPFVAAEPALYGEVAVSFPEVENVVSGEGLKSMPLLNSENETLKPVYVDGILAYFQVGMGYRLSTVSLRAIKKSEEFDKLTEGMTLAEIVSLLGPGLLDTSVGVASIWWGCVDGRILLVKPFDKLNEKANYHINLQGKNRKHKDVEKLVRELISSLAVKPQEVSVTLKQDTTQAKAYETKKYKVGEVFQKVDPLPRIDFRITKIEDNVVHCDYSYVAPPDGILRYSETGSVTLKQDG